MNRTLRLRAFALKTGVLIFFNGRFVPDEFAVVSVFDRGFLYGDGLFETMRVFRGQPFRWEQHCERLQRGADFLKIKLPFTPEALRGFADELIVQNKMPDALLRVTLSRGVGVRGYSPKGAENPTVVMSLHAPPAHPLPPDGREAGGEGATKPVAPVESPNQSMPEISSPSPPRSGGEGWGEVVLRVHGDRHSAPRWKLITSSHRLPANEPLAQFKTCNKLAQILARAEADAAGADEALLLNTDGFVVEGASSNLFWIDGDTICTPPLASGILPGVTREVVLEICEKLGLKTREANINGEELKSAAGVFLSLSSFGVVEAASLNGVTLKLSLWTGKIQGSYHKLIM